MNDLPTKNICTVGEFSSAVFLRAHCDCCSPEHVHDIEVENDSADYVSVNIFSDLEWAQYQHHDGSFWLHMYFRVKNAIKYLVTGSVKVENTFLMKPSAAKAYISAIQTAIEKIEKKDGGENRHTSNTSPENSPDKSR